jgi:hypothetical protein
MTTSVTGSFDFGPDWVVAEMPPGYQNRVTEIQRLTNDLKEMGRFGRLLCEVGTGLAEAVRDVFTSLKFKAEVMPDSTGTRVAVRLDGPGRLLLPVSASEQPIQKKSPDVAHVFQMLHEVAEEHDRVILVTNCEPGRRPSDRSEAVSSEALTFLNGMGAGHVSSATLFALWKLSLQEPDRARDQIARLHAHGRGSFQIPSSAR